MTTAPVPSITEELLQELEHKAAPISSSDWFDAETAMSCTGICRDDAEFITSANPATILAMVERIRSLERDLARERRIMGEMVAHSADLSAQLRQLSHDLDVVQGGAQGFLFNSAYPSKVCRVDGMTVLQRLQDERSQLIAQLERAEKDAARYRWLRRRVGVLSDGYSTIWLPSSRTQIDANDAAETGAAIDAAIAQEGADHE